MNLLFLLGIIGLISLFGILGFFIYVGLMSIIYQDDWTEVFAGMTFLIPSLIAMLALVDCFFLNQIIYNFFVWVFTVEW